MNLKPAFSYLPVFLLLSCNNSSAPDCLQSSGNIISEEISLPSFKTIVLIDDIDLYLGAGTEQQVFVRMGVNLIPEIKFDVKDRVLYIKNDNTCNWVRRPGNPGIYVYSDSVARIESYAYNDIFSLDTLHFRRLDLFTDGEGDFNLAVTGDSLYVRSEFISNFYITGSVKFIRILFLDDSQFHGRNLIGQSIYTYQLGSNLIEVFPVMALSGRIESTGSIYYYNDPAKLDISISGTGKLVRK